MPEPAAERVGQPPALVVRRRRGRLALLASVLLALCGLALLSATSATERVVGGVCLGLFGAIAVLLALPRLRGPALLLDDRGLIDNASALAVGFVPWSAVTGVLVQRVRGQRVLSVLVDDPAAVVGAADPAVRAAMRANLAVLGTPVNIPLRAVRIPVAELTLELARRTPKALPAALRARLPTGTPARPPASEERLAELAARAADVGISLPAAYLELLADQDGFRGSSLRVYASRSDGGFPGVLEENPDPAASGYVVLAADDERRYAIRTSSATFHVLPRSDHRSLGQLSTFSELIVAAIA